MRKNFDGDNFESFKLLRNALCDETMYTYIYYRQTSVYTSLNICQATDILNQRYMGWKVAWDKIVCIVLIEIDMFLYIHPYAMNFCRYILYAHTYFIKH